jgi:hypothetical protein
LKRIGKPTLKGIWGLNRFVAETNETDLTPGTPVAFAFLAAFAGARRRKEIESYEVEL